MTTSKIVCAEGKLLLTAKPLLLVSPTEPNCPKSDQFDACTNGPGMAFTIRQLQYFVAVAEQGTVSRAAQHLSISQSSVTEAIKELEARSRRRAVRAPSARPQHHPQRPPVPAPRDEDPGRCLRCARAAFPASGEATTGRLQLGVTSLVAGYVLSDLLARYRRAYPAVRRSRAIEDNGDYLEHLLVGGELDVAVMVISNLRDRMALQAEISKSRPTGCGCRSAIRWPAPTSSPSPISPASR